MLRDLRSRARIQSDKQKLEAIQASYSVHLTPDETMHYSNIVACINAVDDIAVNTLLDNPNTPLLPSNAWHALAEYSRAIREQDATESERNDDGIQLAFWHLGINRDLREFIFHRNQSNGWIQFVPLSVHAGVPQAQAMIRENVKWNRPLRTRLEDQAKGVPRATAVLMGKVKYGSIDAMAVKDMELTKRE